MEKLNWKVTGMSCTNCALSIDQFLKEKGMEEVKVNFIGGEVSFNLPEGAKDQKEDILMEYIFDVSATGKLEDFNIKYSSIFYNAEFKQSIRDLHVDAYEFIPASINGKPVKSKLVYQIMLYIKQAKDRGTYNIPTQKY